MTSGRRERRKNIHREKQKTPVKSGTKWKEKRAKEEKGGKRVTS